MPTYQELKESLEKRYAASGTKGTTQPAGKSIPEAKPKRSYEELRSSLEKRYAAKANTHAAGTGEGTDVQKLISDASSFFGSAKTKLSDFGYSDASTAYTANKGTLQDLLQRSRTLQKYADDNRETLGKDTYDSLKSVTAGIIKGVAQYGNAYKGFEDYATGFENEEKFDAAVRYGGYYQTHQGKNYDELMATLDTMEDGEEKDWLKQYAPTVATKADYDKKIEKLTADIDAENDRLTQLYAQKGLLQQELQWRTRSYTADSPEKKRLAEEIAQLDAQIAEGTDRVRWMESDRKDAQNALPVLLDGYTDMAAAEGYAAFKSAKGKEREEEASKSWWEVMADNYAATPADTSLPANVWSNAVRSYAEDTSYREPTEKWSQEQKNNFGFLYGQDPMKAYTYAENINNQINRQEKAQEIATLQEKLTGWGAVGHSAGAIAGNMLGLADYLDNLAEYAGRGTITQKNALTPFDYSQAVTSGIADDLNGKVIDESVPVIGGKGWGDVYSLGMSIAESMLAAHTTGGTGSMALFFGSAGASGVDEALERGASAEEALVYGTMLGAAEAIAEKIGIDNLLKITKASTLKAFFSSLLKQGFAEGAEEGLTTLLNQAADEFVLKDKSAFNISVRKYMEEDGLSYEEAQNKAFTEAWEDVVYDTLGGFASGVVSGGLESGAKTALGALSLDKETNDQNKNIYGESISDLIQEALEIDPNNKVAKSLQKKIEAGKEISGRDITRQIKANERAMTAGDITQIRKAAAERLVELGETGDINAIGTALAKQAAGRRLSWNEQNVIASSRYGQRVANELNAENIQSGDYAFQWAQKIRTERIQTEVYNDAAQDGQSAQAGRVGQNIPEVLTEQTGGITSQNAKDNAVAGNAAVWSGRDFENAEYVPSTKGKVLFGDNRVEISDVVSAGNGKMTLALDDGSTAQVTQLSFPDEGATEVYHTVAKIAQSTGEARKMLELHKVSNVSNAEFARGIEEAYLYGKLNYSRSEMESRGSYVNLLAPEIRESVYTLGQTRRQIDTQTRQQQLVDARQKNLQSDGDRTSLAGIAKGKVHFDGDRGKLTDRQKTSITAMKVIARALGVDIYVYEPETSGFGEGAGKNGWYDPKDGSIHINLYAGENGEGVMLFTLAHELTHFIRDWSPTKYNVLADFLTEQYGKKGISVRQQVLLKQADAAAEGRTLTEEQAHEEWVADCMEKMLSDGQIVEKLALLQAKDRGIVAKIRGYLDKFLKKLKAAYGEVEPQTLEGQTVATMVDAAQKLQELFADALTDAAANYHANGKKNPTATGGEVRLSAREESLYKDFSNKVNAVVNQAITGKGNMEGRVQVVDIMPVGPKLAAMVAASSESEIDISNRSISLNTGDVWHEYKRHTSVSDEVSRDQVAFTKRQFQNAIKCMISPDVVETIFRDTNNPTQKQSFAYAKKTDRGHYVVVEAVGGKKNPNIYPVMILQFSKAKWDRMIQQGKTLGEILLEGDTKKLQALDVAKNKKSRVTAAQFASYEAIANTLHSPQLNDIVAQTEFSVKENDSTEKRFSSQGGTAVSDRAMLIDLFAQMVENSNEYRALEHYRSQLDKMLAVEEQLHRVSEEIRKLSFQKGPKDMETLRRLKILQKQAVNRLNIFDNQLLRLEKSGVLRAMIERNRAIITQKSFERAKEYYRNKNEMREAEIRAYYRESRRQAVERHNKAQIRQQIKKDVDRLDSLLNKGNKQKNVKLELQDFAGAALRSARNALLKGYNEYDMVRNGISGDLTREQKKLVAECRELMNRLDNLPPLDDTWDPDKVVQWYKTEDEIKQPLQKKMKILRDAGIFQREYEKQEDAKATELLDELLEAYAALENAPQAHMQKAYSQVVYDQIAEVRKFLTGKQIGDMTYLELKKVYKMYHMVLHVITGANNLFTLQREGDVRKLGEEVISQIKTAGKEMSPEFWEKLKKMGWTLLKPETAFEIIGSETLMELYRGLYRGEDTYARNVEEARVYAQQQAEKYGRAKWDMNEKIQFAGTTITLGQAMSLYAYTKREQAQGHLAGDGFTGSSNVRIKKRPGKLPVQLSYIMNATKTHTVSREDFQSVGDLLTKEQMQYADAMQDYLSHVMGSKGNEVSRQLYGINLFEETAYFPLKTAQEYLEATLGVKKGEAKLKNSGFTNAPQKGAKNPIVLDSFEDVWAKHVDDMSMYHAFVLPMEDLDRVYNYHHAVEENITDWAGNVYGTEWVNTNETVKVDLENRFGKAANDYITDLMQELNGGVRRDPTEVLFGGLLRNFKKTAVLGSLSVAVQQPTAFARAMAELDPQDVFDYRKWLGQKGKPEGRIVEEMYKYAPVALMKHIGGFDPGVGRTTKSYIFGNNQSVREKVNDALGMLPEKMDEWTWTYIWLCTKRQIHRQYPQLAMQSEAFLQKAGERFSQIIRDTQVYDSVLTKPQVIRSKNFFMQMATAFMNEPMTSLDMYIRSTVQAKRGKISKKKLARVWGSVVASQILCSAVASLIYALRDDDEDETYWEKYVSSFVGKSLENLFPLNYVPFVKDVISIFSGYTVERSDMSIITDIYEGWQKISNGTGSAWERYEAFYGSILNLLGMPARNLSRDLRGIFNTTKQAIEGKVTATSAGMKYAAMEGLYGKKASKEKQLNEAVAKNDAGHILRLMASYDDADSAMTAIRKAVKDQLLAEAVTEEKAMELLQAYTEDTKEEAQDKVLQWQCELDTGVEYGEIKESYLSGSISGSEVVKYQKLYGGKTEEETENTMRSYIKAGYEGGALSESKARQELIRYGGLDESEASQKVRYWDFQVQYPQYSELSEAAVAKYYDGYYKDGEIYGKSAESYGIRLDVYAQYVEETKGLKKEEKLEVIDDLKLTDKQKDGLYYLNGWAKSTIDEAPWH